MFNYATIKHLLLLNSGRFLFSKEVFISIVEDYSNSSLASRISNMNIGTWPLEKEELTNSHVKCRELTLNDNNQLFWTKAFLQTSSYDEKRYRQIASNAYERIVHNEESKSSNLYRPSSIIAVSLSETSTRQNSSKNHSTPQTINLPINSRKKSSYTRFSCYLKSHSKEIKRKLPKNNNHYHDKKQIFKLNKCKKCLKLFELNSKSISSNSFCQSCFYLINNSHKNFQLNKTEENELRHIIEIIIEEFQDHFGQALNLSIKQMTQHFLSNINLFYNHYQYEFEQLTKKYRLTFLQRFIQLMKKYQMSQTNKIIQKTKPSISGRHSITHPPDILSMSSLSGSLITEKDLSETIAHLTTPSNSISLSTTSNRSSMNRKHIPIQNSSSKKTFTLNKTGQRQSSNKSRKQPTSSLQLIDAYRFRDTLRMNNNHFAKLR